MNYFFLVHNCVCDIGMDHDGFPYDVPLAEKVEIKNLDEVKKKVKSLESTWEMWSSSGSTSSTRTINQQREQLAQMGKDASLYWDAFFEDPTRHPETQNQPESPHEHQLPIERGSRPLITSQHRLILDALDDIQGFDESSHADTLSEEVIHILSIVKDTEAKGTHRQYRSNQQIYLTVGGDQPASREEMDPSSDVLAGMIALVLMEDGGRKWDIARVDRVWTDTDGTPKMDITYLHPNKRRPFSPQSYPWPADWHKCNLVEWRGPNGAPWSERGVDREAVMWCDMLEKRSRSIAGKLARTQAKILLSAIANIEQLLLNGSPIRALRGQLNHGTMQDDDGGGYSEGDDDDDDNGDGRL